MRPICDEQSSRSKQRGAVQYSDRHTDSWHYGQITFKIKYYSGQVSEYEDILLALKEDHSERMCEDKGAGEDIWNLERRC
jgi:hypothetical protein